MRNSLTSLAAALVGIVLTCAPVASDGRISPQFSRVSPEITHAYTGGWEHFVGGGVAIFDCDGDRMSDLFAAGGATPARLFHNETPHAAAPVSFTDKTPETLTLTGVTGAYPLDIDSDGAMDLVILRAGANLLLQGDGACGFQPFDNIGFSTRESSWTTAFSATWEAGQTLPTLAFGNYVNRDDPAGPFEACDDHLLYRPDGARYTPPAPLSPGYCALSMLFSDWNRSGHADLRISNDRHYFVRGGGEQLWAMEPAPRLYTKQDGWIAHSLWGMGIASRDIDGDGLAEVFLSSMGDQRLQSLGDDPTRPQYRDAPFARGTTAHRPFTGGDGRPSTGWQISFGDVNNDGRDDVFIAKGNVDQMMDAAMDDPNNLLMQAADGTFGEFGAMAGVASMARSRGAGLVDLNLDGRLDLVVMNRRAPMEIYENVTKGAGNWLSLTLRQPAPNRNARGGWIEVAVKDAPVQTRELTVGGGHASGSHSGEHFGLGLADGARVRVIWPDGARSDWKEVDVNQSLTLYRSGDGFRAVTD